MYQLGTHRHVLLLSLQIRLHYKCYKTLFSPIFS